jgi:hypothetical protein
MQQVGGVGLGQVQDDNGWCEKVSKANEKELRASGRMDVVACSVESEFQSFTPTKGHELVRVTGTSIAPSQGWLTDEVE